MKSEDRDKAKKSTESRPKMDSDNYDNEIEVGSVGNENYQDNGASTLRELRRKRAEKKTNPPGGRFYK